MSKRYPWVFTQRLSGKKLKEELYLMLFCCFIDSHFIIIFLPIPFINYSSEINFDELVSNYLNSWSPHSPVLWKKRRKFSILKAFSLILCARSSYTNFSNCSYFSSTSITELIPKDLYFARSSASYGLPLDPVVQFPIFLYTFMKINIFEQIYPFIHF